MNAIVLVFCRKTQKGYRYGHYNRLWMIIAQNTCYCLDYMYIVT